MGKLQSATGESNFALPIACRYALVERRTAADLAFLVKNSLARVKINKAIQT